MEFDCVVSFDLALEVFTLIPCPCLASDDVYDNKLVVFQNNELAMLSVRITNRKRNFVVDMWVMQESAGASGSRWSWIKNIVAAPSHIHWRHV